VGRRKGTPEKFTAAVQKQICDLLELSMPQNLAAEAAGISERTYRYWCEQGKNGTAPYAAFYAAVRVARARGAANLTTRAIKGEKGSAAALVLLARRFPREYGSRATSAGDDADGDWQTQYEREVEVGAAGRASSEATERFNEAIALAVADAPTDGSSPSEITGDCDDER
jgi:hypothetical protein